MKELLICIGIRWDGILGSNALSDRLDVIYFPMISKIVMLFRLLFVSPWLFVRHRIRISSCYSSVRHAQLRQSDGS